MKNKNDLLDLFKPPINQNQRVITKQAVNIHEFYLSGDVEGSEEYIEWFDIIRSASQNDVIKIYINSPGGDMFTAIQFMRVLTDTEAQVIISVEGACMSAATMIFMCGHQYEISPHSVFMFHNYSGITVGKGGEMYEQISFEKKWFNKLVNNIYKDFLTEEEIKDIENGKDLWLDGDEVVIRLKKMGKFEVDKQLSLELGEEE